MDVYQEWVERSGTRELVFWYDGISFDRLDDALAYRHAQHSKKRARPYRSRRK